MDGSFRVNTLEDSVWAEAQWVESFVDDLAQVRSGSGFTNFYSKSERANAIRRHNLSLYLQHVRSRKPRVLLVGEAPGYRGTRITGVPFVDARLLSSGVSALSMLGYDRGYMSPTERDHPPFEQTSTIMWEVLSEYRFLPLLWAAFPFHPHGETPNSNRAPTEAELRTGRDFLQRLIDGCDIERTIAVGRVAERTLARLGIEAECIRHPARGGKPEFKLGIERLTG
jgi:uracil-DNA glycosylase